MTLVPFFPFLYSTHSAYPIHMQTLTDSHILSLSVILSLSHTCTQTCTLEKFLSSDITQPKCGGRSKVSTGLLHGVISPGMGDGRGPGVCGGGGGDRSREERWVRQRWRQKRASAQRGQKKMMNSGELGGASEAAEVSVEVSECTLCPFHFTPSYNQIENTEARGGTTRSSSLSKRQDWAFLN